MIGLEPTFLLYSCKILSFRVPIIGTPERKTNHIYLIKRINLVKFLVKNKGIKMAVMDVKTRKNKNGITFYSRLWDTTKKNSTTITLGKKNEKFTMANAYDKLDKIKELYKTGEYESYKEILNFLNENEKMKVKNTKIEKEEEQNKNKLTLWSIYEEYYNQRFKQIKTQFINDFTHELGINEKNVEKNPIYKKKIRSLKSRKSNFESHILVKEYIKEPIIKKDGTYSLRTKNIGIKSYQDIAKKSFLELNKKDIEKAITIVNEKKLEKKSKYNLLTQLKVIINEGILENELFEMINPFRSFKKEKLLKNPKKMRTRILSDDEFKLLFNELYKLENKNSFIAALMGFCFTARSETVINIKKENFTVKIDNDEYFYTSVKLMNLKTHKIYELPIPRFIGKFLYQYLLDFELEHYVLRPQRKDLREQNQPISTIPENYYKTAELLFYYTNIMKKNHLELEKTKSRLYILRNYLSKIRYSATKKEINNLKNEIENKKNIETDLKIKIKDDLKNLKNNKNHMNKNHYDFHSLRHQSASNIAKINFLYCQYCLSHSSSNNRSNETTLIYSKVFDLEDLENVLTKVYEPLLLEIIEETIEYKLYSQQITSHAYIYSKQSHSKLLLQPQKEYKELKEKIQYSLEIAKDIYNPYIGVRYGKLGNVNEYTQLEMEWIELSQEKLDSFIYQILEEERESRKIREDSYPWEEKKRALKKFEGYFQDKIIDISEKHKKQLEKGIDFNDKFLENPF